MTIIKARYYTSLFIAIAGGLFLIYLSTMTHRYLAFAAIPFGLFISHHAMNLRCPCCKTPVGGRMRNYMGLSGEELSRPQCLKCGYSFEARSKKVNQDKAETE